MTLDIKIVSVIPSWTKRNYRGNKKGKKLIEVIINENPDSDFILFPGGFITDDKKMKKTKEDLVSICNDYDGVLITGFDES